MEKKTVADKKDNAHLVEHKEQVVEKKAVAVTKEPQGNCFPILHINVLFLIIKMSNFPADADVKSKDCDPAPSTAHSSNTTTSATNDYAINRANAGRSTAMW